MDKVHQHVTSRLRAVYGDPKTPDLKTFMAEYVRALSGFSETALQQATSYVIDRHTYPTWPTPGAIRDAAMAAAASLNPKRSPDHEAKWTKPSREERARVGSLLADFHRQLAEQRLPDTEPPAPPDVSRPAFRQMQRNGDPRLHMTHEGLTNLSRRMTGEHNE